jgi:hypothetical protein
LSFFRFSISLLSNLFLLITITCCNLKNS